MPVNIALVRSPFWNKSKSAIAFWLFLAIFGYMERAIALFSWKG
ncbi:hypothetical protein QT971_25380 [Microcoleus sp. herbarium19]